MLLFGVEFREVQLRGLGLERDESRHTRSIAREKRQERRGFIAGSKRKAPRTDPRGLIPRAGL